MKINELISLFEIFTTNEEQILLDKLVEPSNIQVFTEREQQVMQSLLRKSLVSKFYKDGEIIVLPNKKY